MYILFELCGGISIFTVILWQLSVNRPQNHNTLESHRLLLLCTGSLTTMAKKKGHPPPPTATTNCTREGFVKRLRLFLMPACSRDIQSARLNKEPPTNVQISLHKLKGQRIISTFYSCTYYFKIYWNGHLITDLWCFHFVPQVDG